ncbi:MAG TPA: NAD-dependent succinate-semialdehyde dehydrogenase [bacterium]|nr:NAD-dependent succinate-semialdehyde dehydrogenase [bacterium]
MALVSIQPFDGKKIRDYEEMDGAQVDRILADSARVFAEWRKQTFDERAGPMRAAAALLLRRKAELAELMAREMGKPLKQGWAEIEKCAKGCEFYAQRAADFLRPEPAATEARRSYVSFEPLGTVLAVMPWNYPFWQVFRFAAPALMAGNAAVLKHASNVSGCALAIEAILAEAGFPAGLFRTLLLSSAKVAGVIRHPAVKAVTLTGSNRAGEEVAAEAGRNLKKTVLELGGSDPFLVLADADLEKAVAVATESRLLNAGQSCISAKRFIVVPEIREAFEAAFVAKMAAAKPGDPLSEKTELGPLARPDLRATLQKQVDASVKQGARLLLGGKIPEGPGAYYPPTVLSGVQPGMPAYEDEIFGPVAAVLHAENEEDAIRLANDTSYGLGAAVFTRDLERGERIARDRLEAGSCFVNALVRSDPRLPFGGVKASGYGRELSAFGIREFVNIKTVYVAE